MSYFTLRHQPAALQGAALVIASFVLVWLLERMRLPAALLLGSMAAAILLAWFEGRAKIPPIAFVIAQPPVHSVSRRRDARDVTGAKPRLPDAFASVRLIAAGT